MTQTTDRAPRDHQPKKNTEKRGLIMVLTGRGKGKTTAAMGTALRMIGHEKRVAMVQFIKGKWKTGEAESIKQFGESFQLFTMGEGFTWNTQNFDQDVKTAQKAWQKCVEVLSDDAFDLVIFDEINYCLKYNFLSSDEVIHSLQGKPSSKHVILTGDGAPQALIDLADLVTEMTCVKHPYEAGIQAQAGIEF